MEREWVFFIDIYRYFLAKILIIYVEMLLRYRLIVRDCKSFNCLLFELESLTSAEKGQPPPNDPKKWQDTHSITSYSLLIASSITFYCTQCTLHFALYKLHFTGCTLHIALYILHFTHCTLQIVIYILHFTNCTLHITLYTVHFTNFILHIALYILGFTNCTLHIEICTLHFTQ